MIKFEEIVNPEGKLFSNEDNLEVTNIIIFKDIEFPNITFNNHEIKVLTNAIEYGKNIGSKGIPDSYSLYFKNCLFTDKLEFNGLLNRSVRLDDCSFADIILKDIQQDNEKATNGFVLKNIKSIENLIIDFCEFNEKFYINKQNIDERINRVNINKLSIKSTIFKSDFVLQHCDVKNIEIKDADFNSLSKFYEVTFQEQFDLREIVYRGLTLFDKCNFGTKAQFEYIIFEKFTSFRGSKFNKGLNLEYTSSDKEINFYGIEILDKTTISQETYRIIKNQFEKLNNKIEANKYHALELEQKRRELEENKSSDWREKWVFRFHDWSSKHSTDWFRTLLWIIFVGFLTIFLVHFEIVKDLFFHPYHFKIEYISKIWNEFWQYINITNLEKLKDSPFIFFLNKVSLGYLYYQFLTAVRKDTRK